MKTYEVINFANLCNVGLDIDELTPEQIIMIENICRDNIFISSAYNRQARKTTTACIYLLYHALHIDNQSIAISAHNFSMFRHCMEIIRCMYTNLPAKWFAGAARRVTKDEMEFGNGSSIVRYQEQDHDKYDVLFFDDFLYTINKNKNIPGMEFPIQDNYKHKVIALSSQK